MADINAQLEKYTKALGLINGMIPIGVELGAEIVGLIKGAIHHGDVKKETVEAALASVRTFQSAIGDVDAFLSTWLETHPASGPESPSER